MGATPYSGRRSASWHKSPCKGNDKGAELVEAARTCAPARDTASCGFVALERKHIRIEDELNEAFSRLLGSSAFTLGTEVELFEAEFAEYCESPHCVGVASGTAALSLMLRAYGIGPGDEVIVPGHTFIASALAVAHVGATPVLCDVEDATGLIDPDAARAAVGPRTAAILAVHLYGQACDMDRARSAGQAARPAAAGGRSAGARRAISRPPRGLAWRTPQHSRSIRARTLAHSGTAGQCAPTTSCLPLGFVVCGTSGSVPRESTSSSATTSDSMGCRPPSTRQAPVPRRLERGAASARCVPIAIMLRRRARSSRSEPEMHLVHHLFPVRFPEPDALVAVLRAAGSRPASTMRRPCTSTRPGRSRAFVTGSCRSPEAWAAEELSLPMHPDLQPEEIEQRRRCCTADAV